MKNLAVIILTKNEEANLPDCLRSIAPLRPRVFVVDSGSTDRTVEVAEAAGATVAFHEWTHYADQRNWALANLPWDDAKWVLNLDADERLTRSLAREIAKTARSTANNYDGFMLRKRTYFMGRWIRHGGHYPAYHLRLFRRGHGRCEDRRYDQHFVVDTGRVGAFENDYIDILTDSLTNWTDRHNRWATAEAEEIMATRRGDATPEGKMVGRLDGTPIEKRRWLREDFYQRFPLFVRPAFYYIYRYFFRLGFLDGIEGMIFHFLQGFWFRFLVDAKVYEMRRKERQP